MRRSRRKQLPLTQKMVKGNSTLPVTVNSSGNSAKRSRDDLDKTKDHVETFSELLIRMKQMIDEGNSRIECKIDTCNRELHNEITAIRDDVQRFKVECSDEINKISDSVVKLQHEVYLNNNAVMKVDKANDLLLTGVPYVPEENVDVIVQKIANTLGYRDDGLPPLIAKRLARTPIVAGTSPPLLLQFSFRITRDEFYQRYLCSKNLSLNHIGFDMDKRIYLNENLTEQARRIKGSAIKMKKAGKLHSVYTKDGSVYVKTSMNAAPRLILTLDDLTI